MADKRDLAGLFRERLGVLIGRRGDTLARFADRAGLDRSALSQFLTPDSTRLPRAETLCAIAQSESVSLDWLMGLSHSEGDAAEVAPALEIEQATGTLDDARLAAWQREALGYKIRYVPATIPDLLRTEAVTHYEFRGDPDLIVEAKSDQARRQLDYSRLPETDIEVCMPLQMLDHLARGEGIWSGLTKKHRRAQIAQMAALIDELYPTFRLFLFDGRRTFSAPYTVFGPIRAAIYLGGIYLVVNSVEHIRALTRRFDHLIRVAEIGPDRARDHVIGLLN